ncbi:hypothetical protein WA026_023651 [Henosepilachna vigintioctopunctata]|uniref:Uncharacterized protein n=1 Tax=Henosepilachna vigintioctopunctata TaxID=420089 RepID=A0AAW1VJ22_9CUCU
MFFVLSGKSSILVSEFNPPIEVKDGRYVLGLTDFAVYNSIPNIDDDCNSIKIGSKEITIPTGCYQLQDLNNFITHELKSDSKYHHIFFELSENRNTLHTHIKCTEEVDITSSNSIAPLIGFNRKILAKDSKAKSDNIADIITVNSISVECNIVVNSYRNGVPQHIIHQFSPTAPPGFKIVESPEHVIYLPISVNTIRSIVIKIVDQNDKLVNFQQETITVGLHLRKEI